jgi:hypothetical protein
MECGFSNLQRPTSQATHLRSTVLPELNLRQARNNSVLARKRRTCTSRQYLPIAVHLLLGQEPLCAIRASTVHELGLGVDSGVLLRTSLAEECGCKRIEMVPDDVL